MSATSSPQHSPVRKGVLGSINFSRPRTASTASSPMRPLLVGGGGGFNVNSEVDLQDPLLERDTLGTNLLDGSGAKAATSARLSAFVNLLTCFIGGGIVALPCAFQKASIIPGLLITATVCMVTILSLYFLVFIAVHSRCKNYADIGERFGQWAVTLVHAFLALILTGVQISVLILTMDQVRDLVDAARSWSNSTTIGEHVDVDGLGSFAEGGCSHYGNHSGGSGCELPWVESNVFITGIITVAIILPLSLVRKISALRWSSGFAVVALMYTVVLVTAEGAMKLTSSTNSTYGGGDVSSAILANARGAEMFGPPSTASGASIAAAAGVGNSSSSNSTGSIWWNPTFDGVLEATPLIVFSFGCQAQVIPLFNAMPPRQQTTRRFMPVILAAPALYGLMVAMVGVFGVLAFPGIVLSGDVMQGFPSTSIPAVTGRVALVIALTLMMPLLMWPNRDSVTAIVKACAPRRPKSQVGHVIVTVLLTVVEFTLAVVSPGVEKVYGFLGATAGSFLFFIWPSVCVLRTRHPAFGIPLRISAWLVLLFGLAVASLGTYAVVMK